MKLALVHDFLTVFAGGERVLQRWHQLFPDAPIYTMFADPDLVKKHFPNATIHTSKLQRSWFRSKPFLLLPWMPQAVESYDLTDYDLVLSSSGAFSHGILTAPHTTHICYCHSPMRYAWDWHAEYLREKGVHSTFGLFFANQFMSKIRLWDAVAAKRVDQWVANSKTVAGRIDRFYRAPSTVIYPPVDTDFFDASKAEESPYKPPYVMTVSRLTKNKRIDQMIKAVAATDLTLVVGGTGSERGALIRLADKLEAKVRFVGNITEEQKRNFLAGASAFLFAAEDDFGIAPVEALSLGVPVIALAKGGALEFMEDGKNGHLYPEPTTESLTEALTLFLEKGVSYKPDQIRHTALPFSGEHFDQHIRKLVEHA